MLFKKIILLIILTVLLTIFVSCNSTNISVNEVEKPVIIDEISYPLSFCQISMFKQSQKFISALEKYVSDNFAVDVNFKYVDMISFNKNMSGQFDMDVLKEATNFDGIIYVNSSDVMNYLKNNHLILPINSLLEENEYPNYIGEKELLGSKYLNNDIWGIPTSNLFLYSGRFYKKEFISATNIKEISSVEDIIAFCEKIKGTNETPKLYFTCFNTANILIDFRDIFLSYGIYSNYSYPIAYNYNTEYFENIVYNENFKEAIKFIRFLYERQYIIDNESLQEKINEIITKDRPSLVIDDYIVSKFSDLGGSGFKEYEVFFFTGGGNESQFIDVRQIGGEIAVLKDTVKPKEVLKQFIELFYNNKDGRNSLAFGIKNYNYYEKDGIIYIIDEYNDQATLVYDEQHKSIEECIVPMGLPFINVNESCEFKYVYSVDDILNTDNAKLEADSSGQNATIEFSSQDISKLLIQNDRIPFVYSDKDIQKAFNKLIYNIVIEGSDIDKEILLYKENVKSIDEDVVEKLNDQLKEIE